VRPAEVRLPEVRPAEVRLAEVRPAEVRAIEARLAEVRLAEVRPAEVRPVQVCHEEGRPPEVRLPQVRLPDVRPPEGCLAEVCLLQVWVDVGVLITPCVPDGHPLRQLSDMVVVRHGSTLSATTLFWDGLTMRSIRLASPRTATKRHAIRHGCIREELAAGMKLLAGTRGHGPNVRSRAHRTRRDDGNNVNDPH